jgi:hypothetical protein
LVYLKAYPLQVVMGELFGLSQPQVNYWIHRLLPALLAALDRLGVRPERNPRNFPQTQPAAPTGPRLIIDATERRRQRPKNPEKQALHYSGRKKKHCDKNVVVVNARRKRIDYLSPTCPGKAHEKKIADAQGICYPPAAALYKDSGFQGYEPAVKETRQAKKKGLFRRKVRISGFLALSAVPAGASVSVGMPAWEGHPIARPLWQGRSWRRSPSRSIFRPA